jgi:hypothetical protein
MTDWSVDFTDDETRRWQDARRYGFIAAGGARRFRTAIKKLHVGDRIFVKIPRSYNGRGYIGAGIVIEEAVPVTDFMVQIDGRRIPILDHAARLAATRMDRDRDDETKCEWLARIDWRATRERSEAFWHPDLGAIRMRTTVYPLPKWACDLLLHQLRVS